MFEINLITQIYRPSKVILASARTKRILLHTLLILNNVRILKETSKGKKLFERYKLFQENNNDIFQFMTGKDLMIK